MWAACLGGWHHKARDFSRGLFTQPAPPPAPPALDSPPVEEPPLPNAAPLPYGPVGFDGLFYLIETGIDAPSWLFTLAARLEPPAVESALERWATMTESGEDEFNIRRYLERGSLADAAPVVDPARYHHRPALSALS